MPGAPPLSPHEAAMTSAGSGGGGGGGGSGGESGGGVANSAVPHHNFVTDNNMNTSAKGIIAKADIVFVYRNAWIYLQYLICKLCYHFPSHVLPCFFVVIS